MKRRNLIAPRLIHRDCIGGSNRIHTRIQHRGLRLRRIDLSRRRRHRRGRGMQHRRRIHRYFERRRHTLRHSRARHHACQWRQQRERPSRPATAPLRSFQILNPALPCLHRNAQRPRTHYRVLSAFLVVQRAAPLGSNAVFLRTHTRRTWLFTQSNPLGVIATNQARYRRVWLRGPRENTPECCSPPVTS